MATVYCYNKCCKHRNKRPSKTLNKAGNKMHKCTCKDLVLQYLCVSSEEYLTEDKQLECLNFEPIENAD